MLPKQLQTPYSSIYSDSLLSSTWSLIRFKKSLRTQISVLPTISVYYNRVSVRWRFVRENEALICSNGFWASCLITAVVLFEIAEQEDTQKRTFTCWINSQLAKVREKRANSALHLCKLLLLLRQFGSQKWHWWHVKGWKNVLNVTLILLSHRCYSFLTHKKGALLLRTWEKVL